MVDSVSTPRWYRFDTKRKLFILHVHVLPGAKTTAVLGLHGDALKVHVGAAPVDSAANTELLRFVARRLGVTLRHISIKAGEGSPKKLLQIDAAELTPELLLKNLTPD